MQNSRMPGSPGEQVSSEQAGGSGDDIGTRSPKSQKLPDAKTPVPTRVVVKPSTRSNPTAVRELPAEQQMDVTLLPGAVQSPAAPSAVPQSAVAPSAVQGAAAAQGVQRPKPAPGSVFRPIISPPGHAGANREGVAVNGARPQRRARAQQALPQAQAVQAHAVQRAPRAAVQQTAHQADASVFQPWRA